jgi:hypothetical protein
MSGEWSTCPSVLAANGAEDSIRSGMGARA